MCVLVVRTTNGRDCFTFPTPCRDLEAFRMGELHKHRNNGKCRPCIFSVHVEKGGWVKKENVPFVYLLNNSPSEYNFAIVKDDAIAFISILFGERVCIV
jgi:hypothetical protein